MGGPIIEASHLYSPCWPAGLAARLMTSLAVERKQAYLHQATSEVKLCFGKRGI